MNKKPVPDCRTIATSLLQFLLQQNPDLTEKLFIDSKLADAGVDSFSLIELVLFIERQFEISVPLESLTPQKAETLLSLSHAVLNSVDAGLPT